MHFSKPISPILHNNYGTMHAPDNNLQVLTRVLPYLFAELRARNVLDAAFRGAPSNADPQLELALLPNAELRRLKKEYLKQDAEVVDVLAFPAGDFPAPELGGEAGCYLGEVYINNDIARDDPKRALFLLVHGVLHLLGYRHEKKNDSIEMDGLEREVHDALLGKGDP